MCSTALALPACRPRRCKPPSRPPPHPNSDAGRGKPLTDITAPFPIDDGLLFNQLAKWVPDASLRKKILVDNPARLYGFEIKAT